MVAKFWQNLFWFQTFTVFLTFSQSFLIPRRYLFSSFRCSLRCLSFLSFLWLINLIVFFRFSVLCLIKQSRLLSQTASALQLSANTLLLHQQTLKMSICFCLWTNQLQKLTTVNSKIWHSWVTVWSPKSPLFSSNLLYFPHFVLELGGFT